MAELKMNIPDEVISEIKKAVDIEDKYIIIAIENQFLRTFTENKDYMQNKIIKNWSEKRVLQTYLLIMPDLLECARRAAIKMQESDNAETD